MWIIGQHTLTRRGEGGGIFCTHPSIIITYHIELKTKVRDGDIYNFSLGGLNRYENQSHSRNHFILSQGI